MDNRFRQIAGRFRNKESVDRDVQLKIEFNNQTSVIKPNLNTINSVIDVQDLFESERNESNLYRINGKINLFTDNSITQGGTIYTNEEDEIKKLDVNGQEMTQRPAIDGDWDILFDGPPDFRTPNNWLLQICYPSDMLPNYNLWSPTRKAYLGIKILTITPNNSNGSRSITKITTIQKHRLSEGDYIHLNFLNNSSQSHQGIHEIFEIIDEYSFTIEKTYSTVTTSDVFIRRIVNPSDLDVNYNEPKTLNSVISCDFSGGTFSSLYSKTTVSNHGLGLNDFIEVRNNSSGLINGFHKVTYIIDDNNFVIDYVSASAPSVTTNLTSTNFRILDGTPSEYYVRKFEVLTTNEYKSYNASYATNIYYKSTEPTVGTANQSWLFHYEKDINTSDLISHRGGVVNELYLCVLKRAGENTYSWSNVTSHWEFNGRFNRTGIWDKSFDEATTLNGLETVSKHNPSGVGTIEKNNRRLSDGTPGSKYIGDFVEYNQEEIKERTILETIFRFGVKNGYVNVPEKVGEKTTYVDTDGETQTDSFNPDGIVPADENGEGYFYKPFKKIEFRKFSNIIEYAEPEDTIEGIPSDYVEYPDGTLGWRDLLEHGFIQEGNNGVNWPFVQGRHYIFLNHNIYLRRQDPREVINQEDLITVNPKDSC